ILENAVLTGEPEIIVSLQTKYAYVLEQFFLDSIYRNAEIISKELKQRNINYCGSLVRGEVFEYQDEKTEKMINVLKYLSKLEQNKIDTFGEIILRLTTKEITSIQAMMLLDIFCGELSD